MKSNKILSIILAAILSFGAAPAMGEDVVTRAFAVYSFVEAVGEESFTSRDSLESFEDCSEVPEEYRAAMELAVGRGIIKGSGDKKLEPNSSLTRLEAFLILGRCLPDAEITREASNFTDIPDWAEEEIDRLYMAGVLNGYGNGLLGANDLITKEQLQLLTERVRSASPGLKDDFFAAVNRDWLAQAEPGANRPIDSYMARQGEKIDDYLVERSEELLAKYKRHGAMTGAESQAAQFYQLALDGLNDPKSVDTLKIYLYRINACGSLAELYRLNGVFLRDLSIPILFDVTVPVRLGNEGIEALDWVYINYVGTGIERSCWDDDTEGIRAAYETYVSELLDMAGQKVPDGMPATVSAFQRDVALAGKGMAESYYKEEDDAAQSVFTWDELRNIYDGKWKSYYNTMLSVIDPYEMPEFGNYAIDDRGMMDKAVELMNSCDIEVVKTICKINLIEQMIDFLPQSFRKAEDKLMKAVVGVENSTSYKDHAASLTAAIYPQAYEEDYVENRVAFDKDFLNGMTDDIKDAFKRMFNVSWTISGETLGKAVKKLDKMKTVICGYRNADEWNSSVKLDTKQTLLYNYLKMLESVGGDIYSVLYFIDDTMPSYVVNASYSADLNLIEIYAGILFSPIYDPDASYEDNLGGIGSIIAHEISHAFDGVGSYYDERGYYDPWWEEADREKFDSFVEELNVYYKNYADARGIKVDSRFTSNENIADILGMACVIELAKEKNIDLDKVFRNYARSWAAVPDPEYADYLSRVDVHSPNKLRVNAVLSNFDEFYEIYGIKEGDGMYVAPEDRVRLFD